MSLLMVACGDDGMPAANTGGSAGSGAAGGSGGSAGTGGGSGGSAGVGGSAGSPGGGGSSGTGGLSLTGCENGPLDAPIVNCAPTVPASTGDDYADCVARINQLRWECQCLPPLQRWTEAESCADEHALYDSTRAAHSGFRDNICALRGYAQNECPGWNSNAHTIDRCLQAMWDEGPGEPFSVHGHYINMSNPTRTKVACGFFTTPEGKVWAVQNFQ